MYTEGTLRPPSPKEMRERYLPLETLDLSWYDEDDYRVRQGRRKAGEIQANLDNAEPPLNELSIFMVNNDIPLSARIVYHECGSHQLALDWTED